MRGRGELAFNSIQYALFLAPVVALFWHLRPERRKYLLLGASYAFYAAWDWRFLGLIVLSTVTDYWVGRRLEITEDPKTRRATLILSLVVNLGLLGVFKYLGFFVDSAVRILETLGVQANPASLNIILPVGISFYTFQTLSYTIDVYRGKQSAVRDPALFATFVAFFPQLVAGPIERASFLIPQLESGRQRFEGKDLLNGLGLIAVGLFKKVAIADVAAQAVNVVFDGPEGLGFVTLMLGVYAFALQIYGDFSGYTDIARGSARLFGIQLSLNFTEPYLARSITEFWRRWHITLSTWLRDYLYIPLGGNRQGTVRTYRNLMLTMLLGGLWHGAAWTFVVWGGLHGLLLAWERLRGVARAPDAGFEPADIVRVIVTFHLVCLGWIFFRAASFTDAWTILTGIVTFQSGDELAAVALVPVLASITIVMDLTRRSRLTAPAFHRWPAVRQGAVFAIATLGVVIASGGPATQFIYFQF